MIISNFLDRHSTKTRKTVLLLPFFCFLLANGAIEETATFLDDIKNGPTIYYTPQATAFFATQGNYTISGLSVDKDAAVRTLRAAIKLGGKSLTDAKEVIPVLIDYFPKAIHVSFIQQARYMGEGTFEDCVSTYVMGEKNKFLLSSTFLDYNTISLCEDFVDAVPETEILQKSEKAGGVIAEAIFNLRVTFTLYAAECALSKLTGMNLGHDPAAWRQWWFTSGTMSAMPAATPSPYVTTYSTITNPAPQVPSGSFADIVTRGKYRIFLTTGDALVGTVDSRTDSSLILETTDGKPFAFNFSLMSSYQTLELPKPSKNSGDLSGALSYEELKQRKAETPQVEIKISSGTVFKGTLQSIDNDGLVINVQGNSLPIAKDVIKQISILSETAIKQTAAATTALLPKADTVQGPFDSLWVKNPHADKYGKPQADLLYWGVIIDEGDNFVTLKTVADSVKKITRDNINRFTRHSAENTDAAIKNYAKQLICPSDMMLVDMPFGRGNKPFFKVCMDKYEFENRLNSIPKSNISYTDAAKLCEQQGKRLCTSVEWQWACSGKDGMIYPYGLTFDKDRCNSDSRMVETSGNRINCTSPYQVHDMVGNVFEWVSDFGKMAAMGGPFSKCQTVSPSQNGDAKPQIGFRCCKSN